MTRISVVLLPAVAALSLAAGSVAAQTSEKPLTVEAIFAHGPLIGHPPDELTWSPDGKHLTYLEGGELMDVDPATGRTHVLVSAAKMAPLDENNVSERDRDHRERYKMASYLWAPDSTHLLFDSDGRLWLYDLRNGTGVQIGFTGLAAGDDPKFSPDGCSISFIRDHGLAVIRLHDAGTPMISLAPSPAPAANNGQVFLNGEVDWVYEEELDVRSNYFWSPDSKNLAYLQMNETQVPRYPITDWIPIHASVDWQRYPQPGDPNPDVHVGSGEREGRQDHMGQAAHPPGRRLHSALRLGRPQDSVDRDARAAITSIAILYFADAEYGDARQVLEITDDKFLDENYDVSVDDGAHCSHQLERRPQPHLSLQLRQGEAAWRRGEAGEATDQGRFRGGRCVPRRRRAQSRGLRVERRQSAGAAGLAGQLRR